MPGLVVVAPSTPEDNYGLLHAARAAGDPGVSKEHEELWGMQGEVRLGERVELGRARTAFAGGSSGNDVTIVSWSRQVQACVDAARELGLPEGRLPLAEAAVLLATAPKSNSAYNAINAAMRDIRKGKVGQVPRHLQNVHADSTGSGKAPAYKYPHDYPHHYVAQRYLPEALGDVTYYEYGDNKTEQAARRYWEDIKKN